MSDENPAAPMFSIKLEISPPGQTMSLYSETSIKAKDAKVLQRPPLLYTEKSFWDDSEKMMGYTPGNIREYIKVGDSKEIERELLKGHGERFSPPITIPC